MARVRTYTNKANRAIPASAIMIEIKAISIFIILPLLIIAS